MKNLSRSRINFACSLIVVVGSSNPLSALEVRHNVAFTTLNQNPWVPGEAFVETFHYDKLKTGPFNVNLPDINADPIGSVLGVVEDFLGVPLPFGVGVKAGATVEGSFGLDFGYHVNGGRFHMNYPARSSLDIATYKNTGAVVGNLDNRISTSFLPGINGVNVPASGLVSAAGGGYASTSLPGVTFERFENPQFGTEFPYAAAWAEMSYDIQAGAFIEGRAFGFKARKSFTFGDSDVVNLAKVNRDGIFLGPTNIGVPFDQEIPIANFGTLKLGYPDVQVTSDPVGPNGSLHGFGSKPIISLQGQVEKLIPVIGPFLDNWIGPIHYTLFSTAGGPSLNLYQDFTFTPQPRVQLAFSEPILHKQADGSYLPTNTVNVALGEDFDIRPMFGPSDQLIIQPTYFLNNTFRNETGLSLGVNFDFDALSLETPIGDLGPVLHADLDFDHILKLPVYNETFVMPMNVVHARSFNLPKANFASTLIPNETSLFKMATPSATLLNFDPNTNLTTYRMEIEEVQSDTHLQIDVTGVASLFSDPNAGGYDQTLLITSADVIVNDPNTGTPIANLGRHFCVSCLDGTSFFQQPLVLDLPEQTMYFSQLFDYPSGVVDVNSDPLLTNSNYIADETNGPTIVEDTVITPLSEPEGILFSNLNEPHRDATPIGNPMYWAAQSFYTDDKQYKLESIKAMVGNAVGDPEVVVRLYTADSIFIGELITTLTAPVLGTDFDAYSFTPDAEVVLDPNTIYWVVIGAESGSFDWSYEDTELGMGQNTYGPGSLVNFADSSDAGENWTYYSLLNPYRLQINVQDATSLSGDYNNDGIVDIADYVVWRDQLGGSAALLNDDTPGVGSDDYDRWVANFGATQVNEGSQSAVPESGTLGLLLAAIALFTAVPEARWMWRQQRSRSQL